MSDANLPTNMPAIVNNPALVSPPDPAHPGTGMIDPGMSPPHGFAPGPGETPTFPTEPGNPGPLPPHFPFPEGDGGYGHDQSPLGLGLSGLIHDYVTSHLGDLLPYHQPPLDMESVHPL
jgi:hypothetical protein